VDRGGGGQVRREGGGEGRKRPFLSAEGRAQVKVWYRYVRLTECATAERQ